MLSLEFFLGFCHGIAKGGDCKVEFNQLSCWLYSVSNLLVIQHLEILFRWESCKGSVWENVKEKLKSVHSTTPRDWISWLAHGWQVTKVDTRVKHVEKLKSHASWSITWQNFQSGQTVSSWLKLATQWSCGVKSPDHSIWEKLTFRIPNTHQYKYHLYPRIVESF